MACSTNITTPLITPDEEYEFQFYGFSSTSVLITLKCILDEVFESILNSMENKLISQYNYEEKSVNDIKESLLAAYRESIELHTNELKEVIQTYFSIPKNVLLPEDELQKNQYTEEDEAEVDKELDIARKKLIALTAVETKLKTTVESITKYKQLEDEMQKLLSIAENLEIKVDKIRESPIMSIPPINSLVEQFTEKLTIKKND